MQSWLLAPRRDHMTSGNETAEVKLVKDLHGAPQDVIADVIKMAHTVWGQLYGRARRSPGLTRIDANCKRAKLTIATRSAFLRRRRGFANRLSLAAPARSLNETAERARAAGAAEWTEGMEKEIQFNTKKRRAKFLSAVSADQVPPERVTVEERHEAAKVLADQRVAQDEVARSRQRANACRRPVKEVKLP